MTSEKIIKKLFTAAKHEFEIFEARFVSEKTVAVQTYNGETELFSVADNGSMKLRGVKDGKCGSFTSDRVDAEVVDTAIAATLESAQYGQPIEPEFFIGGGAYKYTDTKSYHALLDSAPTDKLIALCKAVDKAAHILDARINNVNVQLEYASADERLINSNGLDINSKTNYMMIAVSGDAKDGEETQSGFRYAFIDDIDKFDAKALAAEFVSYTTAQFGAHSVAPGKYKAIFAPECIAALLSAVSGSFSAFALEQHMSLLENKIGTQAFSELLTVRELPLEPTPFSRCFDAEGVPCQNKTLIDRGVPTGFVYDLATAKRARVKSTGNGKSNGAVVRPSVGYTEIQSGKLDLEGLCKFIGDGVYITLLGGIATGLDSQSGNYSLQAEGYVVRDGKIAEPLSLITVASNVMDDLKNIIAVGGDAKTTYMSVRTPSVAVAEVSVSGV